MRIADRESLEFRTQLAPPLRWGHTCFSVSLITRPNYYIKKWVSQKLSYVIYECSWICLDFIFFHWYRHLVWTLWDCILQGFVRLHTIFNFFIWSQVRLRAELKHITKRRVQENNYDCLSNGEWSGKSPRWKSLPWGLRVVIYRATADQLSEAQVSWNGPPWRVKAPSGFGVTLGAVWRVVLFGTAALSGR